jgi:hypothetical protein
MQTLAKEVADDLRTNGNGLLVFHGDSSNLGKLISECAEAQAEYGDLLKDTEGQVGHQRFKYARLSSIMKAVRPALARRRILVLQPLTSSPLGEEWQRLTTILAGHGARIEAAYDFKRADLQDSEAKPKAKIQEWGRILTYLRRYCTQSAFVLEGDADADDAHPSDKTGAPVQSSPPAPKRAKAPSKPPPRVDRGEAIPPAPGPAPPPAPAPEPTPPTPEEQAWEGPATPELVQKLTTEFHRLGFLKGDQIQAATQVWTGQTANEIKKDSRKAVGLLDRLREFKSEAEAKADIVRMKEIQRASR